MMGCMRFVLVAAAMMLAVPSVAADLKVISAGAVRGLIAQIIEDYSRQTGQKFDFTIGTTGQLRNIIASGQPADLLIVSTPLMAELEKTGKFLPASRADLGRVGIGVAVRDGAATPDVATPEAFKAALVAAKSVAYSQGASGRHFQTVIARLGLVDTLKPKTVVVQGKPVGAAVAAGEAEIGVQQVAELMPVPGIDLVGPLPDELQKIIVYVAAVPAKAKDPEGAKALAKFFASDAAVVVMKQKGMKAVSPD
jgi:molybdate transport system substrate-binding protein